MSIVGTVMQLWCVQNVLIPLNEHLRHSCTNTPATGLHYFLHIEHNCYPMIVHNHYSISFIEKLLTLHMPSKSLHRYSTATLSALRGLGLTLHDLITTFTPWPDAKPAAQNIKGLQSAVLPLSLDYAGLKSSLIFLKRKKTNARCRVRIG